MFSCPLTFFQGPRGLPLRLSPDQCPPSLVPHPLLMATLALNLSCYLSTQYPQVGFWPSFLIADSQPTARPALGQRAVILGKLRHLILASWLGWGWGWGGLGRESSREGALGHDGHIQRSQEWAFETRPCPTEPNRPQACIQEPPAKAESKSWALL